MDNELLPQQDNIDFQIKSDIDNPDSKNVIHSILVISLVLFFIVLFAIIYKTIFIKSISVSIDPNTSISTPVRSISLLNKLLGINNYEAESAEYIEIQKVGLVPDTNQEHCFSSTSQIDCGESGTDFFGQDAQYVGTTPKFVDNSDGTVSDINTGLMWQKYPGEKLTFSKAQTKVESLKLTGYTDWRIPTIKELYSLMDFRGTDPSGVEGSDTTGLIPFIDLNYFYFEYGAGTDTERIIDSQYGSSNLSVSPTGSVNEATLFGVNFADGRIKGYGLAPKHNGEKEFFFMFVRGNDYGINEFIDNHDGTITDNFSGLTWQQGDSENSMNWEDSLSYCEDLTLDNSFNWRLPNIKELQSIVDYSSSPDFNNSAAIDQIFNISSITNEAGQLDYPYFWSSTTHENTKNGSAGAYITFGRAMGYMDGKWVDVHGAGAQRSDPKTGDHNKYPEGHGPQGDAIRIYNYARCVRDGSYIDNEGTLPAQKEATTIQAQPIKEQNLVNNQAPNNGTPPREAIDTCKGLSSSSSCSFKSPNEMISGVCNSIAGELACVPRN